VQSRLVQRLEAEKDQTIDLSPLLDVVFILLIFFIVSTVFIKETGVEVDKPKAVSSTQLQQQLILIAITADGRVMYDGSNIGVAGVQSTVSQLLSDKKQTVVIQADQRAQAKILVEVIDASKLAGAKQVNLATEQAN